MRRLAIACAAIAATVSVLAAASPASATPYHLIRWQDTGFCQIWDQSIPTTPWPANFSVVSVELPTFDAAVALFMYTLSDVYGVDNWILWDPRKDEMVWAHEMAFNE